MDILRFSSSIPQRFTLNELFDVTQENSQGANDELILKGVVCFLGAHYYTYIKVKESDIPVWKLYDDHKQI